MVHPLDTQEGGSLLIKITDYAQSIFSYDSYILEGQTSARGYTMDRRQYNHSDMFAHTGAFWHTRGPSATSIMQAVSAVPKEIPHIGFYILTICAYSPEICLKPVQYPFELFPGETLYFI